jgi:RHS repeat-associated protein
MIVGVKNLVGPAGEDEIQQSLKAPHLAENPEAFIHDADGNLTDDARWHYTWDGENRLITVETSTLAAAVGVPKQKLEFAYDAQSRRFQKKMYWWNTSTSAYALSANTHFLYDGWNLLADLNGQSSNAVLCTYVWGLDLSGSWQGAGGVGGLLFSTLAGEATSYVYAYDGNGNVSTLIDLTTGTKAANYDYNAFGETVAIEGTAAIPNAFRFSTKYIDEETGYFYFGLRYCAPELGRWLSKDPIEEFGGNNLYRMVGNSLIHRYDLFGLVTASSVIESLIDTSKACKKQFPLVAARLEIYLSEFINKNTTLRDAIDSYYAGLEKFNAQNPDQTKNSIAALRFISDLNNDDRLLRGFISGENLDVAKKALSVTGPAADTVAQALQLSLAGLKVADSLKTFTEIGRGSYETDFAALNSIIVIGRALEHTQLPVAKQAGKYFRTAASGIGRGLTTYQVNHLDQSLTLIAAHCTCGGKLSDPDTRGAFDSELSHVRGGLGIGD